MINFFRKIRQNLLFENSPGERAGKFNPPERRSPAGRYLIYAVGEIVLVVIGILIALQINNWNESRKAFNNELQLYSNLMDDLIDQNESTNIKILWMESSQNVHYQVYNETKGLAKKDNNQYYNSLEWIFPFHLDITEKYTESLKSISNSEIRDILKYYIRQEKETKDAYDEWNELKVQRLRPFFNKHGIHNTEAVFNDEPYDFYSLSSHVLMEHTKLKEQYGTTELDELLYDLRFKTSWVFSNLHELKEAFRKLRKALDIELELHSVISWQNKKKYTELIVKADEFYDSKDFLQSANKYKEAFDLKNDKINWDDWYNAACTFALIEDKESAFNYLFELANGQANYKNHEHLITDVDLEILHSDKRWKELISIVKSNH